jgi:hypothetical protein
MLDLAYRPAYRAANRLPTRYDAPSLDLNFTAMSVATIDSRISFSRSSPAWMTDSTGTIVRGPHNLLLESQSFDAAAWTKTATAITANAIADPLTGTLTTDAVTTTASATNCFVQQTVSGLVLSNAYTASVYLKAGTAGFARLRIVENGGSFSALALADINLTSGAVVRTSSGGTATAVSSAVTSAGNGWWRIAVTGTLGGAVTAVLLQVYVKDTSADTYAFGGTIGQGIYTWGAQLEQHTSARDYLNTSVKNLLGFSEAFDNAAWTKTAATITANAIADPLTGTLTADKLVESATAAIHEIQSSSATVAAGVTMTGSVYVKTAGRFRGDLRVRGASGQVIAKFDLSGGTVVAQNSASGVGAVAAITALSNGWFRVSVTGVADPASSTIAISVNTRSDTDVSNYTGDGTSGLYVWGAQLSSSGSLDAYSPNAAAAPTSAIVYGPRFDYRRNTTGAWEPAGLLIEEARTNLALRSADLTNAVWGAGGGGIATVTTAAVAAPDGGTAHTLTDANGAAILGLSQSIPVTSGTTTYTGSVYAKSGTSSIISVRTLLSGGTTVVPGEVVVNLSSGAAQWRTSQVGTSFSVTAAAGGWWRISVTVTDNASGNNALGLELRPAFASTYTATLETAATGTAHFWGAQLEAGAFATSYIPTTTTAVTRTADVCSLPVGSWYNASAGTLFAEFQRIGIAAAGFPRVASFSDGTTNNVIEAYWATVDAFQITSGGVTSMQSLFSSGGTALNKLAAAWATNDATSVFNGVLLSDQTVTIPTGITALQIGNRVDLTAARQLSGWVRRLRYYNRRLENNKLTLLTL